MKKLAACFAAVLVTSCANYEVGSISERYCNETDPIVKQAIKNNLTEMGIVLPVDYCLTRMIVTGK